MTVAGWPMFFQCTLECLIVTNMHVFELYVLVWPAVGAVISDMVGNWYLYL